jgi:hypothetical protein
MRRLTLGERTLATSVFADALDLDPVRMIGSPWPFTRAFVPGRIAGRCWIVWPRRSLPDDIASASLGMQATLIHELVHVWQAQQGTNLLVAKLKAGDGAAAYAYPLDPTCGWDGLNIEQQASAVEHRFRLSRGQSTRADAAFYDRLCPFPETERFDLGA